ncbi:unnamed protein product [Fusarium equiseti]|uniref:Uncharacterized protein n=1 Tax=Fusarium equiseti TaxID=61235 RepID=A0A8J2IWG0_FUSEQ|nr:unnamed protein product [Fusarium equiseti]
MNFGEQRAGVITAFNPRTVKMLHPKTPAFHGHKKGMMSAITTLADELSMTPTRTKRAKNIASGGEMVGLGVNHIDMLPKESRNGGLDYIFQTCKQDLSSGPALTGQLLSDGSQPGHRLSFAPWSISITSLSS